MASERPYDWRRDCPEDVVRVFPPVAGTGRGEELSTEGIEEPRRKMRPRELTTEERPM